MRTGRPPKEVTPYKIMIHKNGGRRYASTKIVISETNGKKEYRHKHWGTIDDENKFHPNDAFILTPASERDRLIFPEGIDLTEIAGVTSIDNATPFISLAIWTDSMGPPGFWIRLPKQQVSKRI